MVTTRKKGLGDVFQGFQESENTFSCDFFIFLQGITLFYVGFEILFVKYFIFLFARSYYVINIHFLIFYYYLRRYGNFNTFV